MITFRKFLFDGWHKDQSITTNGHDCGIGNILFFIAGTIGIATKNGYSYGLPKWVGSEYFVNPIPEPEEREYTEIDLPWGFNGFDIPDNSNIFGWMQSEKYFEHCEELIRNYFIMKPIIEPIKDTIIIHYRAYKKADAQYLVPLQRDYYMEALKHMPDKDVVVITDNINRAKEVLGNEFKFISNTPIEDFQLLRNADYVVMSNSSFSWWGAWLSQAQTICPKNWIPPTWGDIPGIPNDQKDIFCNKWTVI
jgi:hypothetical protein